MPWFNFVFSPLCQNHLGLIFKYPTALCRLFSVLFLQTFVPVCNPKVNDEILELLEPMDFSHPNLGQVQVLPFLLETGQHCPFPVGIIPGVFPAGVEQQEVPWSSSCPHLWFDRAFGKCSLYKNSSCIPLVVLVWCFLWVFFNS